MTDESEVVSDEKELVDGEVEVSVGGPGAEGEEIRHSEDKDGMAFTRAKRFYKFLRGQD